jgi:hypothetical protein
MRSHYGHQQSSYRDATARTQFAIGQLEAELKALVDRLESDISSGRRVDLSLAADLRSLRERAEQLFPNPA